MSYIVFGTDIVRAWLELNCRKKRYPLIIRPVTFGIYCIPSRSCRNTRRLQISEFQSGRRCAPNREVSVTNDLTRVEDEYLALFLSALPYNHLK
jgi:hypothetical protein